MIKLSLDAYLLVYFFFSLTFFLFLMILSQLSRKKRATPLQKKDVTCAFCAHTFASFQEKRLIRCPSCKLLIERTQHGNGDSDFR